MRRLFSKSVVAPGGSLFVAEDQQRINSFSKLNTRYKAIEEKISALKVNRRLPDTVVAF